MVHRHHMAWHGREWAHGLVHASRRRSCLHACPSWHAGRRCACTHVHVHVHAHACLRIIVVQQVCHGQRVGGIQRRSRQRQPVPCQRPQVPPATTSIQPARTSTTAAACAAWRASIQPASPQPMQPIQPGLCCMHMWRAPGRPCKQWPGPHAVASTLPARGTSARMSGRRGAGCHKQRMRCAPRLPHALRGRGRGRGWRERGRSGWCARRRSRIC